MPHPPLILTVNGEARPLNEWATRYNLAPTTIVARIRVLKWDAARAVTTPPDSRFRRGGRPRADAVRRAPAMSRHAPSGRARVTWRAGGRVLTRYLGEWGSAEAKAAYRRFCAEWAAGAYDATPSTGDAGRLTVGGLVLRRIRFAEREYRKGDRLTSEYHCQRAALGPLNELYGATWADEFGPVQLRAVRETFVSNGWARDTCNGHTSRVVAAFGWAAGEGWIPATVPAALREVAGLKAGKTAAPERKRKRPVPDAELAAVMPFLSPFIGRAVKLAAMLTVQRLTGMRPGEVCALRPCDLDRSSAVWLYTVPDDSNKNLHRDKLQRYWIGPRAQDELRPYLDGPADRRAFGPTPDNYTRSVRLACELAGVTPWTPHQLRHSLATEVARELGTVKAAADAIGDTPETAARHYVHVDPAERQRIEWARDRG